MKKVYEVLLYKTKTVHNKDIIKCSRVYESHQSVFNTSINVKEITKHCTNFAAMWRKEYKLFGGSSEYTEFNTRYILSYVFISPMTQ